MKNGNKEKRLSKVFRRKLLKVTAIILIISAVVIAFIVSFATNITVSDLLSSETADLKNEVGYESELFFGSLWNYATEYGFSPGDESFSGTMKLLDISHWDCIDENGIIVFSDDKSRISSRVSDDPVFCELSEKLRGKSKGEYCLLDISKDDLKSNDWSKYVGICMGGSMILEVQYTPEDYYRQMDLSTNGICNFKSVGNGGMDVVVKRDGTIVSPAKEIREQKNISVSKIDIEKMLSMSAGDSLFQTNQNGTDYFVTYTQSDGYYIISMIPKNEILFSLYVVVLSSVFLVILLTVIIFLRVNSLTKKLIVKNIGRINSELSEITGGNLDVEIDVKDNLEFKQLSEGINTTVSSLKEHIEKESKRFSDELVLAHAIQTSSLPNVFPPFPNRHDLDIFASMAPAKVVGGDFYDFFFSDSTHFVFLVADVSDKGIPAAMFMMKSKTMIKSLAQANRNVDDIIFIANNALCEDNEADMFVTMWFGILDTEKGILSYVNAGHCKPLIRRAEGTFEYLSEKPDFVVAAEESVMFRRRELYLSKGDALFLYTDGVTEAADTADRLYGDGRLRRVLNEQNPQSAREICEAVQRDLTGYSSGAVQTDDVTMFSVVFNGSRLYREISVEANVENLNRIITFIEDMLNASRFDSGSAAQMGIIADEVCSNIINYSYPGENKGTISVAFSFNPVNDEAEITFTDSGIRFNPLNAPEPEIGNLEDGEEGGLGIFLIKRYSDKVFYEYSNGQNILKIIKKRTK